VCRCCSVVHQSAASQDKLTINHGQAPLVQPKVSTQLVSRRRQCSLGLLLAELLNSDAVHVHGALRGKGFAHSDGAALLRLVLSLTDETGLLELLEAVADVLSSSHSGVLHLDATAGLATEVLAESLHASLLSHVQLVADGGGTGVKPVIVEGSELSVASGLNGPGPLLNIILINHWNEKQSNRERAH
jgi:hypothetical protein